jgi:hypothetical protein
MLCRVLRHIEEAFTHYAPGETIELTEGRAADLKAWVEPIQPAEKAVETPPVDKMIHKQAVIRK